MIEFLNRLFGRQQSGATAKERLRLVLMSDHLSLAPEMVEAMKRDLVDVISKYVEVDRQKIEVNFEHQDKALAMLANIPIVAVNRNGGDPPGGNKTEAEPKAQAAVDTAASQKPAPAPAQSANGSSGSTARKRRRKKSGGSAATGTPAPAT